MKPASEVMKDKINKINFKKPINQIVCNVNAKPEKSKCYKKTFSRSNFFNCKMERKFNLSCLKWVKKTLLKLAQEKH